MQLNELKEQMRGVQVILMTPFNTDGSLDLEGMRGNIRWLTEYATDKEFTFIPLGSNSEFYAMSDEEQKAVIEMVVEETAGRAVVMAGAGRAGTRETIKICQDAEALGADGALVILPYYFVPEEEGMYQHYKQVAESVGKDFGIMVYNNPGPTGSWIKPSLMARLAKIPNIIGVKECTEYVESYYDMQRAVDPKDAVILCGNSELMFSFEALYGCPGFMCQIANFAPDLSYSIYKAGVARDFDKLTELVDAVVPFFGFASKLGANHGPHTGVGVSGGNVELSVYKAAMDIAGLKGGEVRLPLVGLKKEEKDDLRDVMRSMKIGR